MLNFMPPRDARKKWCFFIWAGDDYAIRMMMTLCVNGFQIVMGYPVDFMEEVNEQQKMINTMCRKMLNEDAGIYWTDVTEDLLLNQSVEIFCKRYTETLDLCLCLFPKVLNKAKDAQTLHKVKSGQELEEYFGTTFQRHFFSQTSVVVGLQNILKNSRNVRIIFHCSGMFSITEASSSVGQAFRISFSAVAYMVKIMSIEYEPNDAVVVGAHLGLWYPGISRYFERGLSASDAVKGLMNIVLKCTKDHTGKIVRPDFTIIKA